jgi:hypothetical protein
MQLQDAAYSCRSSLLLIAAAPVERRHYRVFSKKILSQISALASSTSRIAPRNKSGKESEGGVLYCSQGSWFTSAFLPFFFRVYSMRRKSHLNLICTFWLLTSASQQPRTWQVSRDAQGTGLLR